MEMGLQRGEDGGRGLGLVGWAGVRMRGCELREGTIPEDEVRKEDIGIEVEAAGSWRRAVWLLGPGL